MRVNPEACRKICHHLRALGGVEHPCKFTILAFFLLKGMFYFIIYLKTTLPKTLVYRFFVRQFSIDDSFQKVYIYIHLRNPLPSFLRVIKKTVSPRKPMFFF